MGLYVFSFRLPYRCSIQGSPAALMKKENLPGNNPSLPDGSPLLI
jgi:hypothetical protein